MKCKSSLFVPRALPCAVLLGALLFLALAVWPAGAAVLIRSRAQNATLLPASPNAGVLLSPPLDDPPNNSYQLTALFDHSSPNYLQDNQVVAYNGQISADCDPHCYQGHAGWDWAAVTGTPVKAAADGVVVWAGWVDPTCPTGSYGQMVVIKHNDTCDGGCLNGNYRTLYGHLYSYNVIEGQTVKRGDVIGTVGTTGHSSGPHLHFGVYRDRVMVSDLPTCDQVWEDGSYPTDPFGWQAAYTDPLTSFGNRQHTASCLWVSNDDHRESCADYVFEDKGNFGFTLVGTWTEYPWYLYIGSGSHMYARLNYGTNLVHYADWGSWPIPLPAIVRTYSYIPAYHATTRSANYQVFWESGHYNVATVDQLNFSNKWVYLRTDKLPAWLTGYVRLDSYTGETAGTTEVGVDAIRFRTYQDFAPGVYR